MKKTLLFSIMLFSLLLAGRERSRAQITGMSLYTSVDTSYYYGASYCVLPYPVGLSIYGNLTGGVGVSDSATVHINWGDGSDTSFSLPAYGYSGGGSFSSYGSITHTYTIAGIFAPIITATDSSISASDTLAAFSLSDSCGSLVGQLFVDTNGDCARETGEVGLAYLPIFAVNTSTSDTFFAGWTNDSGNYAITLTPGSYTIIPGAGAYGWYWWWYYEDSTLTPECPTTGTYSLTVTSGSAATKDFAYTCATPDSIDLSAYGWNGEIVRGMTGSWLDIWAGNWYWWWDYTCEPLATTVTLTLDAHLTYTGTYYGPAPTSVSGSTLTWNVSSAADLFYFYAGVEVSCDSSVATGDSVCNTIHVDAATGHPDPSLANNTNYFCNAVRSSFDPNEKVVAPQGVGTPGYIHNGTELTYDIHFQNTGSAAARNITIDDTLSTNVDMTSFHVLHSTAPVNVYTSGNVVKFRFNNINLPYKALDAAGSIGSVTYAILPKHNLAPGTTITSNPAGIYFDYNPAVLTNSTLNTIWKSTGVGAVTKTTKVSVYPNPADAEIHVTADVKTAITVSVMDLLGRTVAMQNSSNGSVTIPTSTLPSGMYLVKATTANGSEQTSKVTVQH
jgi:uncharacterized repeat protein (TIGR01451 family)